MKKVVKIALIIVVAIMSLTGGGIAYVSLALPNVKAAPELTVPATPEMVERGRYLANHVAACTDCHSTRDWSKFAGPIIPGTHGKGGEKFSEEFGFPGTFYARNITPYNLAKWTDGELYRLITTGVTRDGEPIFPVMPYPAYAQMDPEDIKAIIAYIRTLQPIANDVPESQPNFPMNLIMRTMPQEPAAPGKRPSPSDKPAYGTYIATISGCTHCHTPMDKGTPLEGMFMAGGFEFNLPGGTVRSSNLTSHPVHGIGNWTEEQFVQRFKLYQQPEMRNVSVGRGEMNTVMPWFMYSGMTDDDLKAVFAYLKTLPPNDNKVEKFTPALAAAH